MALNRIAAPLIAASLILLAACDGDGDGGTGPGNQTFRDCTASAYSIGQAVNGTIATGDCEVRIEGEEKYVDVYRLNMTSSRGVVIGLFAGDDELDAYLYLYNAQGTLLDENDDFDLESTDAGIVRTLPAGEYFIVASSFSTSAEAPDDHGAYSLRSAFSN